MSFSSVARIIGVVRLNREKVKSRKNSKKNLQLLQHFFFLKSKNGPFLKLFCGKVLSFYAWFLTIKKLYNFPFFRGSVFANPYPPIVKESPNLPPLDLFWKIWVWFINRMYVMRNSARNPMVKLSSTENRDSPVFFAKNLLAIDFRDSQVVLRVKFGFNRSKFNICYVF
jgi:hypothetical protein